MVALIAFSGTSCAHQSADVTLAVRLSSSTITTEPDLFDTMPIVLIFRNTSITSTATVCLCTADSVWFDLKRDGSAITPLIAPHHFSEDPRVFWKDQLVTVGPGETKEYVSSGPNFVIIAPAGRYDPVLNYFEANPGHYSLRAHYWYRGPDFGKRNVIRAEQVSNEVTFTVTPTGRRGLESHRPLN
jgi:hypothetical protein